MSPEKEESENIPCMQAPTEKRFSPLLNQGASIIRYVCISSVFSWPGSFLNILRTCAKIGPCAIHFLTFEAQIN